MFRVVIPARFGSTRLPGKALASIAGHPMVYWSWCRAKESSAAEVVVATDHEAIASVMADYGADVVMTRADHPSGTDRLAEVAMLRGWDEDDVVVNLQGDEPLMPAGNIEQVARELLTHPDAAIATLSEPILNIDDVHNPAVVKVVASDEGRALYFSRAVIPFPRAAESAESQLLQTARRHVGLYAYRCGFLSRYVTWEPAAIEQLESLEQLRALAHGEVIRVVAAAASVPAGVDTEADLEYVRQLMEGTRG